MKKSIFIALAALSVAFPVSVSASETRCGWYGNTTPGNWWLTDSEAQWTIAAQLGFQAQGMNNLPQIDNMQKILTSRNNFYGYGCACLEVETDKSTNRITMIYGSEALPLSTCRNDPNLPSDPYSSLDQKLISMQFCK